MQIFFQLSLPEFEQLEICLFLQANPSTVEKNTKNLFHFLRRLKLLLSFSLRYLDFLDFCNEKNKINKNKGN